jgi:hypothetical protein
MSGAGTVGGIIHLSKGAYMKLKVPTTVTKDLLQKNLSHTCTDPTYPWPSIVHIEGKKVKLFL